MEEDLSNVHGGWPTQRGFRCVGIDAANTLGLAFPWFSAVQQRRPAKSKAALQAASCPPFERREGWGTLVSISLNLCGWGDDRI
jgi:hypothetical protein